MHSVQKWNEAAAEYQKVFQSGMNEYSKELLCFLLDNEILQPGCRVIDVGCGVGKYGTYFAALGCDVTLTDISAGMLEMAKQNMSRFDTPWTTLEGDFADMDPGHPALKDGFDLGISTMCPAIRELPSVKKFSGMIHGWCFITHFTSWDEPIRRAFFEKLGIRPEEDMGRFARHMDGLIQAVKDAGYTPHVRHVPYSWSDDRTPEEAAAHLLNLFENLEITDELKERAVSAARALCNEDGMFVDRVDTTVAWVWWNTKGE